jgi:hypothetical protein
MFPEDAIQSMVTPWWTAAAGHTLARGRLVYANAQHADASAFVLTVEGKKEPTDPTKARLLIAPLRSDVAPRAPTPPSPALPLEPGEAWVVRRARWRPCLVLGATGPAVHKPLRTATPEAPVGPALLVAPYYEAAGLDPAFVARVRRAEYPHCVWDRLPGAGQREVVLRLDQVQALGRDPLGFEWTDHALSPAALATVDAWLQWNLTGALAPGELRDFRDLVREG